MATRKALARRATRQEDRVAEIGKKNSDRVFAGQVQSPDHGVCGFAIAKSITRARREIPEILADLESELTAVAREATAELYDLFRDLDCRIGLFDKKIDRIFRESEDGWRAAVQIASASLPSFF